MTVLYEGRHPVAFILSEGAGQVSRDAITIGAEQDIEPGQLLGRRGDAEHVAYDPGATDGAEVAVAIAMYPAKTGAGETMKIAGFIRMGEVNGHELVLPDGLDAIGIAKAYADLALNQVIVRN